MIATNRRHPDLRRPVSCAAARPAEAIPAFARKYQFSCSTCHAPAPRLKPFGEAFAARGFRLEDPIAGAAARDLRRRATRRCGSCASCRWPSVSKGTRQPARRARPEGRRPVPVGLQAPLGRPDRPEGLLLLLLHPREGRARQAGGRLAPVQFAFSACPSISRSASSRCATRCSSASCACRGSTTRSSRRTSATRSVDLTYDRGIIAGVGLPGRRRVGPADRQRQRHRRGGRLRQLRPRQLQERRLRLARAFKKVRGRLRVLRARRGRRRQRATGPTTSAPTWSWTSAIGCSSTCSTSSGATTTRGSSQPHGRRPGRRAAGSPS